MGVVLSKKICVIEAAEKLFALNGYAQTGIREVGKTAGINSAMISYYFGSKEMLVKAIIEHRTLAILKGLKKLHCSKKSPLVCLCQFIEDYFRRAKEHVYFHLLVVQLLSSGKEHVLICYYRGHKEIVSSGIEKIIENGQQLGIFKPDVDIPTLNSIIQGTMNQVILDNARFAAGSTGEEPEQLISEMLDRSLITLKKVMTIMLYT